MFIPDYASIVNPMIELLKKDTSFEWTPKVQDSFNNIKASIICSLVLISPNLEQDFIMYYFSSEGTITAMLTQRNRQVMSSQYLS